jgi:hypothetical protein
MAVGTQTLGRPRDLISTAGGGNLGGMAQRSLKEAEGAGQFSALGSPLIRAAIQRMASRNAANRRRRGDVTSRILGLDPISARQAAFDVDREASGDVSRAIGEGDLSQLLGAQQFQRGLFGSERELEVRQMEMEQRRREAEKAQRAALFGAAGRIGAAAIPGVGGFLSSLGSPSGGSGSIIM